MVFGALRVFFKKKLITTLFLKCLYLSEIPQTLPLTTWPMEPKELMSIFLCEIHFATVYLSSYTLWYRFLPCRFTRKNLDVFLFFKMDPWAATKKALHSSSCPGAYPTAACPKFHVR